MAKVKPHALARQLRPKYKKASKIQKGVILDRFVKQTGYTRKAAIHLLNEGTKGTKEGWSKRANRGK